MDIFLGSSRQLFDVRMAFAALVDTLSDEFIDSCGEDVVARMWENESYAIERDRSKQAAYDEVVRASDLAFFLVDGYLGTYTLHEYLVATESLTLQGTPGVVVWARQASPASPGTPLEAGALTVEAAEDANVRVMLEKAQENPRIEVRSLSSTAAILLDMLQIMMRRLGPVPLCIRDGCLWSGHKRLIELTEVPAEKVNSLCQQLAKH